MTPSTATVQQAGSDSAPPEITDRKTYREELAQRVTAAFAKLAGHKDDIEKLWKEFDALETGEVIMGCATKTEFCDKVLGRHIRTIQYLLSGRPSQARPSPSPAAKPEVSEQSSCPSKSEAHDAYQEWAAAGMPHFNQPKAPEPYAEIMFRCATEEDLDALSKATGQTLTAKTKSAWFPYRPHRRAKASQ